MKNIAKLLEMEMYQSPDERKKNPDTDPIDARAALYNDVENLTKKIDFFFGSAGDVADTKARRKMAAAINAIRPMVQAFSQELEAEVKKADQKVHNALKRFY